ncbi:surface protease GP63 [Trypanosoma cruzi]|nr:surface protease GP63 [Trypanosoma cruzi]
MSEYSHILCELGVLARRCTSDCYFSGWCLGSMHEMSAKRPMDSCPITDPALDVRDIEAVIWRGEYLSAVPGDEPSSWCLDTLPNNTTDARNPEETHLSAAAHAALRCLSMQLHLEVTEEGNIRCVPCTDGRRLRGPLHPTMGDRYLP